MTSEKPEKPSFPFKPSESPKMQSGSLDETGPMAPPPPPPPPAIPPPPAMPTGGSEDETRIDNVGTPENRPKSNERIPIATSNPKPEAKAEGIRVLGPYTVFKELARGGMGAVFDAEDEALRRRVAIKIMAKELADNSDALARFQREARATASIDHPNVARIYMVGMTDENEPYLAMEFIDGGALDQLLKGQKRLPFSKLADLMIKVCEGLNAAKKQGIIHRDIKPANIMLTSDGGVKVVDFGLAKVFGEESYNTMAGTVMGTPRYMAPEQGQGREVDFRADIYSLGACFYHLMTGRPPFDGDSPTQIMMKHVTAPLPSARSINPDVPLEFDDIIRKCMAKDYNDRYQDYLDLISDLSHVKVQCMARERNSGVNSLPTINIGPGGMPSPPSLPPTGGQGMGGVGYGGGAPSGTGSIRIMETHPEPEEVPAWRKFAILGAIVVVVLAITIGVITTSDKSDAPVAGANNSNSGERGGLAKLLERLMEETDEGSGGDSSDEVRLPKPDPNYIRFQASKEIMETLGLAMLTYRVEEGDFAPDLATLVTESYAVGDFDTGGDGTPLDGWGVYLQYDREKQLIHCAGMDNNTGGSDDFSVDDDQAFDFQDRSIYDELEKAEEDRKEAVRKIRAGG